MLFIDNLLQIKIVKVLMDGDADNDLELSEQKEQLLMCKKISQKIALELLEMQDGE
jgi:hypothetical protein